MSNLGFASGASYDQQEIKALNEIRNALVDINKTLREILAKLDAATEKTV